MNHSHTLSNPGPLRAPKIWTQVCVAAAVIGLGALAFLMRSHPKQGWSLFVLNHFFFLSIALGGVFFLATQAVTNAMWGAPVRRIAESFSSYLPIAALSSVVLVAMSGHVYEWTDRAAVLADPLLRGKAGYLSLTGFAIRTGVTMALWIWISRKLVGHSVAQDATGDPVWSQKNRTWAPVFLILFAVSFTFAAFDQLMSLDPHWFSTMFGLYAFAGLAYSTHALLAILTVVLRKQGALKAHVNDNHLHDLGKWMFAFTVFWAYIGFSQFMLIWYANMPEETGYFLRRFDAGWASVSLFLVAGKFLIPFFALLPRAAKRSGKRLVAVGCFMLAAQWIDLLWLIQPEFFRNGPEVGILGVLVGFGFAGLFGLSVLRFLGRHNVVAVGDPRLHESVFHHHQ